MFALTGCANPVMRDITSGDAPFCGLHMPGCKHVLTTRRNFIIAGRICSGILSPHFTLI
jgi:hypothetical protein